MFGVPDEGHNEHDVVETWHPDRLQAKPYHEVEQGFSVPTRHPGEVGDRTVRMSPTIDAPAAETLLVLPRLGPPFPRPIGLRTIPLSVIVLHAPTAVLEPGRPLRGAALE